MFDRDINSIMKVVNGIERDFQFDRLNDNFKKKKLTITQNLSIINSANNSPTFKSNETLATPSKANRKLRGSIGASSKLQLNSS